MRTRSKHTKRKEPVTLDDFNDEIHHLNLMDRALGTSGYNAKHRMKKREALKKEREVLFGVKRK